MIARGNREPAQRAKMRLFAASRDASKFELRVLYRNSTKSAPLTERVIQCGSVLGRPGGSCLVGSRALYGAQDGSCWMTADVTIQVGGGGEVPLCNPCQFLSGPAEAA